MKFSENSIYWGNHVTYIFFIPLSSRKPSYLTAFLDFIFINFSIKKKAPFLLDFTSPLKSEKDKEKEDHGTHVSLWVFLWFT